jgi:predicted cupin superfamily sugar epimerase
LFQVWNKMAAITARSHEATRIIEVLGLLPHPEGGHFAETWRDEPGNGERGVGTAIYYLLQAGEISAWHRVDAVEIWHWHAGAPLKLSIVEADERRTLLLGPDIAAGGCPQGIVPKSAWQSAQSLGEWTLVGCTVSPAFQFSGFELAPADWTPPD